MALLSPSHRTSFDHHSTGIKAKWLINPLIDHVIDMGGRGDKAMSGNCWGRHAIIKTGTGNQNDQ